MPDLLPVYTDSYTKTDYELTYYLNDISMQNVQVAQEYDGQGSLTNSYTYGTERLSDDSAQGTTDTYLYDGRGSVVQTHDGSATTRSLTYDAFGGVNGGVEPYEVLYAFNGEEYSDTTQLQYLRARYYAPELAAFISKDTELGVRGRINSFNRFAFAEGDPVNNFDPTGHAIGNTTYERQMEAAGGINELYNFYVGNSLQASLNRAQAGFNAQLNYAKGVDYTSARAINSIAGISQETANAYILNGALGALSVGLNYGCMPGALVAPAIGTYVRDVNTAKDTTNTQIAIVKDNKVALYNQYQAYLAWLREQARIAAAAAAADAARNTSTRVTTAHSNQQPVSTRTKAANAIDKIKTTLSRVTNSLAGSLAKPIARPTASNAGKAVPSANSSGRSYSLSDLSHYTPVSSSLHQSPGYTPAPVDWGTVGTVTFIAVGTILSVAALIGSAGTATPALAALWYSMAGVSLAFGANDINEVVTGNNVIRDSVMFGNDTAYNVVNIGSGFINPTKGLTNLGAHADDAVDLASNFSRYFGKTDEIFEGAATSNPGLRAGRAPLRNISDYKVKSPSELERLVGGGFHGPGGIKDQILDDIGRGKFEGIVGKNPNISVAKDGDIALTVATGKGNYYFPDEALNINEYKRK